MGVEKILDGTYSAAGRATEAEYVNLVRQLAPGADPCFDYSQWDHASQYDVLLSK